MKDFEELFALLTTHGVKAVVVGAYAVAYHARPRYTKDIDVLIEPENANIGRLLAALADFGFGDLGLSEADFRPGQIVQLGMPPSRIDFLTRIDGVSFDEVWEHRVAGKLGEVDVDFIALEDLIRNKKASGRPQDLVDLAVLQKR